jgi:uncharacterized membrane protein YhaH (DUF805 family)
MTFTQAISSCYSNYATFSGRASRSEYWFFALFYLLIALVGFITLFAGIGAAILIISALVNFLPSLSVTVRRLHDTDHSGWWFWIQLIPLVGAIIMLVFLCTRGSWGENRFGPDPLGGQDSSARYNSPRPDLAEELARLAKLRADGTLSDEEFQRLKTKLI